MEEATNIAFRIKKIRERLDLSQSRFGGKVGLTGKTISAYETGRCIPTLRVLEKMSEVYGEVFLSSTSSEKKSLTDKLTKIKEYISDIERLLTY